MTISITTSRPHRISFAAYIAARLAHALNHIGRETTIEQIVNRRRADADRDQRLARIRLARGASLID